MYSKAQSRVVAGRTCALIALRDPTDTSIVTLLPTDCYYCLSDIVLNICMNSKLCYQKVIDLLKRVRLDPRGFVMYVLGETFMCIIIMPRQSV